MMRRKDRQALEGFTRYMYGLGLLHSVLIIAGEIIPPFRFFTYLFSSFTLLKFYFGCSELIVFYSHQMTTIGEELKRERQSRKHLEQKV